MQTRLVLTGMTLQAFATAFLTRTGLITPSPEQQTLAGIFFLVIIAFIILKKKS